MKILHRFLIKYGVHERCQQLLAQCPKNLLNDYLILVEVVKQIIRDIHNVGVNEHQKFLLHLLIAATRGFEGYDSFTNHKNETKPFFKSDPFPENWSSSKLIRKYIAHPVYIFDFDNEAILQSARKKFSEDKVVLTNLCQFKVTQDQIDKFFEKNEVKYFISQAKGLRGLSSFDGMTSYVNIHLTDEIQRDVILHEWSHNFPRFIRKNKNPLYISPKQNRNLHLYVPNKKKIVEFEAGEYFDQLCLKKKKLRFTPFALLIDT